MMWSTAIVGSIFLIRLGVAATPGPTPLDPRCEKVLPAAAANRLSGRTDLALYARGAVPAGGGTCNYATPAKKMVFLVSLIDGKSHAAENFARMKADPAYGANQREVAGLGDAAFTGGSNEHLLVIRKGSLLVSVAAMVQMDRGTHQMHATLTREQLIAIGREVAGKL
jgi:hypothetical protein